MPALGTCAVLIGTRDLLPVLRPHVKNVDETLAFTDGEVPQALEAITTRQPRVIVFERLFAMSSRGAALMTRIKGDPSLGAPSITILSHEGRALNVSTSRALSPEPPPRNRGNECVDLPPAIPAHVPVPPQPCDYRGTRRAPRVQIEGTLDVLVDGTPARPIDLSVIGIQVLSPKVLRPGQHVRMTLNDEARTVRTNARIAWALFERPKGLAVPFYRAGIEFTDADSTTIQLICNRHARD